MFRLLVICSTCNVKARFFSSSFEGIFLFLSCIVTIALEFLDGNLCEYNSLCNVLRVLNRVKSIFFVK